MTAGDGQGTALRGGKDVQAFRERVGMKRRLEEMKLVSGGQPWPSAQPPGPPQGKISVGGGLEGAANPAISPHPRHFLLICPADSQFPEVTWRQRNERGGARPLGF